MEVSSTRAFHPHSSSKSGAVFYIGKEPTHVIMAQNAVGELLGPFETTGEADGSIKAINEEARQEKSSESKNYKNNIGAVLLQDDVLTDGWEIAAVFEEPLKDRVSKDGTSIEALAYVCIDPDGHPIPDDTGQSQFDSVERVAGPSGREES